MSKTMKRWTPQEEEILKKNVSECKTLAEAFIKVASEVDKTPKAVSQHYYYVKKHTKKHILLLSKKEKPQVSFLSRVVESIKNLFI